MTIFEGIVAASLLVMAFTKLYDWLEWQITQRQEAEDGGYTDKDNLA